MKIKFDLYFDTESNSWEAIDPKTGEIKTFTSPKKTTTKKTTKEESKDPTLTLESNKYILNQAAVDALGVEPDDRIDIKYEKQGKTLVPIIGSNVIFGTKAGNKLTKSNTVSCRGKANEELSEFGTQFLLVAHPTKEGLFCLQGDKPLPEPVADEVVEIDEDEETVDVKDELDDLLDSDNSDDIKEITNFDFSI